MLWPYPEIISSVSKIDGCRPGRVRDRIAKWRSAFGRNRDRRDKIRGQPWTWPYRILLAVASLVTRFDTPRGSRPATSSGIGVFESLQIRSVRRGVLSLLICLSVTEIPLCEFSRQSIWANRVPYSMYGEIIDANRAGNVDKLCTSVSP